ncbi:hypothetical protein QOT17_008035 [Balamuthia mandrillaris]
MRSAAAMRRRGWPLSAAASGDGLNTNGGGLGLARHPAACAAAGAALGLGSRGTIRAPLFSSGPASCRPRYYRCCSALAGPSSPAPRSLSSARSHPQRPLISSRSLHTAAPSSSSAPATHEEFPQQPLGSALLSTRKEYRVDSSVRLPDGTYLRAQDARDFKRLARSIAPAAQKDEAAALAYALRFLPKGFKGLEGDLKLDLSAYRGYDELLTAFLQKMLYPHEVGQGWQVISSDKQQEGSAMTEEEERQVVTKAKERIRQLKDVLEEKLAEQKNSNMAQLAAIRNEIRQEQRKIKILHQTKQANREPLYPWHDQNAFDWPPKAVVRALCPDANGLRVVQVDWRRHVIICAEFLLDEEAEEDRGGMRYGHGMAGTGGGQPSLSPSTGVAEDGFEEGFDEEEFDEEEFEGAIEDEELKGIVQQLKDEAIKEYENVEELVAKYPELQDEELMKQREEEVKAFIKELTTKQAEDLYGDDFNAAHSMWDRLDEEVDPNQYYPHRYAEYPLSPQWELALKKLGWPLPPLINSSVYRLVGPKAGPYYGLKHRYHPDLLSPAVEEPEEWVPMEQEHAYWQSGGEEEMRVLQTGTLLPQLPAFHNIYWKRGREEEEPSSMDLSLSQLMRKENGNYLFPSHEEDEGKDRVSAKAKGKGKGKAKRETEEAEKEEDGDEQAPTVLFVSDDYDAQLEQFQAGIVQEYKSLQSGKQDLVFSNPNSEGFVDTEDWHEEDRGSRRR